MKGLAAALLATALVGCRPGVGSDLASPDPARRASAAGRLTDARDAAQLSALIVAQQDPHPRVRAAAATALGVRGGARSLESLAPMLADPDPEVVSAAAHALATLRPDGAPADARLAAELSERAGRALALAYGRADSRARIEIAEALRAVGTSLRDAVEAEARQLWEQNVRELRGGSPAGRAGAAEELGRSGRSDALKLLVPILRADETDPDLAAAAARGLGASGDPSALEPLAEALRSRSAPVAEASARALGTIGDARAAEDLGEVGLSAPARLARAVVQALDDLPPAPAVGVSLCEMALRSLAPEVTAAAAAAARSRAADCPERPLTLRIGRGGPEAAAALGAFGSLGLPADRRRAPAEKALGLLATSGDAGLRAAAARALGQSGFAPAVPALQRRLGTSDVAELAEVAVALARLAPDEAGPVVARLAGSTDARLRLAAARALSGARSAGAVEPLSRLAGDPDAEVRREAYGGLARQGPPAVAALGAALVAHAADPGECEAIVRALGATADPAALPLLSPLLTGALAPSAALAIGKLGAPAGAAVLLEALRNPGPNGRLEIVEALSTLESPEAGEALSAELLADRPPVRAAAARALGRLRFEAAAGRLEALRSDYDADVRRAAREALARLPVGVQRKP